MHNHVAVQVGDSLQDLPAVSPGHLLRQGPVGLQLVLYRALKVKNKMQYVRRRQAVSETCPFRIDSTLVLTDWAVCVYQGC